MPLPAYGVDVTKLRSLVQARLCELGQLEIGAFQMTERLVVRAGEACGIYFCLHGPRNVRLAAACNLRRRQVLIYGSDGRRVVVLDAPAISGR